MKMDKFATQKPDQSEIFFARGEEDLKVEALKLAAKQGISLNELILRALRRAVAEGKKAA